MPDYKGYTISLFPRQKDDEKWVCEFLAHTIGKSAATGRRDYADGTFDSSKDAEDAALKKAKLWIDSN